MRSVETHQTFPLSSIKPLEGMLGYRAHCLEMTRQALRGERRRRERSPVTGARLEPYGMVDGITYGRCPDSGSLFVTELPEPAVWARLLAEVGRFRHSGEAFHANLTQSRADYVYAPKVEWIEDALRLQEVHRPSVLEVFSGSSDFTRLLRDSGSFAQVLTADESELAVGSDQDGATPRVQAVVLLESLDRAHDPEALVRAVVRRLSDGGLLFVTALVASGFDLAVLGLRNLYLYPPDRTNCFTLQGLSALLARVGLTLLEVSTPGVLDVEIVRAHVEHDPSLSLSAFERQLVQADRATQEAFQAFLQQQGFSSFARIVTRKAT